MELLREKLSLNLSKTETFSCFSQTKNDKKLAKVSTKISSVVIFFTILVEMCIAFSYTPVITNKPGTAQVGAISKAQK